MSDKSPEVIVEALRDHDRDLVSEGLALPLSSVRLENDFRLINAGVQGCTKVMENLRLGEILEIFADRVGFRAYVIKNEEDMSVLHIESPSFDYGSVSLGVDRQQNATLTGAILYSYNSTYRGNLRVSMIDADEYKRTLADELTTELSKPESERNTAAGIKTILAMPVGTEIKMILKGNGTLAEDKLLQRLEILHKQIRYGHNGSPEVDGGASLITEFLHLSKLFRIQYGDGLEVKVSLPGFAA